MNGLTLVQYTYGSIGLQLQLKEEDFTNSAGFFVICTNPVAKWFSCDRTISRYSGISYSSGVWCLYSAQSAPSSPSAEHLVDAVAFGSSTYYRQGSDQVIGDGQMIPQSSGFTRCDCPQQKGGCFNQIEKPPTVGRLNGCQTPAAPTTSNTTSAMTPKRKPASERSKKVQEYHCIFICTLHQLIRQNPFQNKW